MQGLNSKYRVTYLLDSVAVYSEELDFLPSEGDFVCINNINSYVKKVSVKIKTGAESEISFDVICYQVGAA